MRSASFSLLGETLIVGVLVALGSLGVVTALPALALAARYLRAHLDGRAYGLGGARADFFPAVAALGPASALAAGLLPVLWLNLLIARDAGLPGAGLISTVTYLLMAGVVVVALRRAGAWALGRPHGAATALTETAADLPGTGLLLGAVAMTAAITLMFPPLLLVVGGLLALAGLAVQSRLEPA
ncbi:hypothetical protein [Kineosporia succinea]|uniref:Uncharacterized protein n=1 Tax=Kineosporia succinea TaxID=84632 RepID=A0ABT9P8F9_9ACTN|nr:hypothetical protein [Kineosporia succinea]MDP9828981.1 hypothetical protein [Kineosporia succinea]